MERQAILYLAVGFLLGAVLIWILQPGGASETPQLLGGKYVVMSNQHGNWIYERQANGEFKPPPRDGTLSDLGRRIGEVYAETLEWVATLQQVSPILRSAPKSRSRGPLVSIQAPSTRRDRSRPYASNP